MHPLLYEINTRCWLRELSQQHRRPITLGNIPDSEIERWVQLGLTHIWLMGVWSTGPRSQALCRELADFKETWGQLLPDFSEDDLGGSPYAIAGYDVSEVLGGEAGLNQFRKKLNSSGLKLILDFIPNHTGLDHRWLEKRPEFFVQSARKAPGTFRQTISGKLRWIAHGRDPNFEPWTDTAQLDYRKPATRAAMIEELKSVARRCDGVRCDMAMLLLDEVFARTWAQFPSVAEGEEPGRRQGAAAASVPPVNSAPPENEFWAEAIGIIKAMQPDFLFLAEAYWDLEKRLLDLGFDFAYDKRLTDHIIARRYAEVQRHLFALPRAVVDASAHFLENHDEPRIASLLSAAEHRAAALLILGLPGMRFLHEGQLTGAKLRVSVHLNRRPPEAPQADISGFYELLLAALQKTAAGRGEGELLKPISAWAGNPTAENLIVVQWQAVAMQFDLVAINLAPHPSQCYVKLTAGDLAERHWRMTNLLGPERFERDGAALCKNGLYLDLPAHGAQLFQFRA